MSQYLRKAVDRAQWYHRQDYADVPAREAIEAASRDFQERDGQ